MDMKKYISMALAALMFAACEKEGEKFIVDGLEKPTLQYTAGDLVLSIDKASLPVLFFGWDNSELTLSGGETEAAIPDNVGTYKLEFSPSADFSGKLYSVTNDKSMVSYTVGELNVLAKDLGLEPNVASKLYVRVNASLAENTEAMCSNVIELVVTPYSIDMSTGLILDKDKIETGKMLYSPEQNGEYYGFVAAAGWYNWYMQLGDGSVWGNENVNWTPFEAMSGGGNFWYPGILGSYYTTLSTNYKNWTATLIPALSLAGDVTGDMSFVFADNKWYVSFTTTAANQSFTVSGTGKLYDVSTGTDDASAVDTELKFGNGGDGKLLFGSAEPFTVAEPGEYTFTMYLNDFNNLAWEITSGATEIVEPLATELYVLGLNDNWDYATVPTLTLKSEVDSLYAGFVDVSTCPWGFYFSKNNGSWDGADLYKSLADGTIVVGNTEGADNIAWTQENAGLYYIEVNVSSNMSCTVTAMTDVSFTGFNDDWGLFAMEKVADGIYAGTVSLTKASEWGGQVTNSAWSPKFGGSAGKLDYTGNTNFTDDAAAFAAGAGDYDIIVDFNRHEYFFIGQQVYIGGQGDIWTFDYPLAKKSYGVYEADIEFANATPWGIVFYLYKDNWDVKIGGSNLSISADNYEAAKELAVGTYTVTLDLINRTCTFTAK